MAATSVSLEGFERWLGPASFKKHDLVGSREYSFGGASPTMIATVEEYLGPVRQGDSAYYGDYLSWGWKREQETGWIRIYFGDSCDYCKFKLWTLSPRSGLDARLSWEALEKFVLEKLLPDIGATDVKESSEID